MKGMRLWKGVLALLFLTLSGNSLEAFDGYETGRLNIARRYHTATLLTDGRVLVVGGKEDSGVAIAFAELWDPDTGSWSLAGRLSVPRYDHTATRLPDGRVLIVGGWSDGPLSSAEVYDPTTGQWTRVASLVFPRSRHTATLLLDGTVLVAGGQGSGGRGLELVERFRPATGSWLDGIPMENSRYGHRALLDKDGNVFVLGGIGAPGKMERLPAGSEYWVREPTMMYDHTGGAVETLSDGRIIALGNQTPPEIFQNGQWVLTGPPAPYLSMCRSLRLPDGRIVVSGGSEKALLFDPTNNAWQRIDLKTPRNDASHSMTLLHDGRVLIAGGSSGSGVADSAEVLDFPQIVFPHLVLGGGFEVSLFVTNHGESDWSGAVQLNSGNWPAEWPWQLDGQRQDGISEFEIILRPDETRKFVLTSPEGPLVGWLEIRAMSPSSDISTSFFYNYLLGEQLEDSTGITAAMGAERADFPVERSESVNTGIAVRRTPGQVLFVLYDQSGTYLQSTSFHMDGALFFSEIFAGVPDNFLGSVAAVPMDSPRIFMTVLRQEVRSRQPLRFQLTSIPAKAGAAHPPIQPPRNPNLLAAGDLNHARYGHTATTLTDGRVLVAGGRDSEVLRSAEIFDPDQMSWTETAKMNHARVYHTATLLQDGTVLVVGGTRAEKSAEIFRPPNLRASTEVIWTETKPLNFGRVDHTATLLLDGRVLIVGGGSRVAEIYDPVAQEWVEAGTLQQERSKHSATLTYGQVVEVVGGHDPLGKPLDSCEHFFVSSETWSTCDPLETARYAHTATATSDGRLVVVGGLPSPDAAGTTEISSTWDSNFRIVQGPPQPRVGHSATRLSDGRILVIGGSDSGRVSLFDPGSESWSSANLNTAPQVFQASAVLDDGRVLVTGGTWTSAMNSCWLLDTTQALYPHLVLGGGFEVILMVTNRSDESWIGEARLSDGAWPEGQPWYLDGKNRSGSSAFPIRLKRRETQKFVLSSPQGPFVGSLEIRSGNLLSDLAVSFFYNYSVSGGLIDSVGSQASEPSSRMRFPVERSAVVNTGLAVRKAVRPLYFQLFDQNGELLRTTVLELDGAKFIHEIFAGIPENFVGSVGVSDGIGGLVHLLVLRQEVIPGPTLRFQLTSIPASPEQ